MANILEKLFGNSFPDNFLLFGLFVKFYRQILWEFVQQLFCTSFEVSFGHTSLWQYLLHFFLIPLGCLWQLLGEFIWKLFFEILRQVCLECFWQLPLFSELTLAILLLILSVSFLEKSDSRKINNIWLNFQRKWQT